MMNDKIKRLAKAGVIILVVITVIFAFTIVNQNQPLLMGDDMSVWFEHEYSELREEETAI